MRTQPPILSLRNSPLYIICVFSLGCFCILYYINQSILQVFLCSFIFLPVVSSILLPNFFLLSAIDYIWVVPRYFDPDYLWSWASSYIYKLLCSMKCLLESFVHFSVWVATIQGNLGLRGAAVTLRRYPKSKGKGEAPARWYEGQNHI